jgi:hypothetical protein
MNQNPNEMTNLSAKIPFDSTKERISRATKELASELHRVCLGRRPTKIDALRFRQMTSTDDIRINDQYFDGKKIGSFFTTYILDIPRSVSIKYKPAR